METIWWWLSPNLGRSNSTPRRPGQPQGSTQPPIQQHLDSLPWGCNGWGAEVTNEWCYTSTPLHATVVCTGRTFTRALCRHLFSWTDEKYLKPWSGRPHWGPKFELGSSRIRSKSDNPRTATLGVIATYPLLEDKRKLGARTEASQYHVRWRTLVLY
jgi:hypothetical protein